VVEDNDALARLVGRQLGSLGYKVLQAHDATEALVHLAAAPVDLLFTDIVMPGAMDGWELARHVQQRWPHVRILLTSGFSESRATEQPDLFSRGMQILAKPYRQTDLAQAVRDALARPAA
jgi:CheY-like chemotaxis protein